MEWIKCSDRLPNCEKVLAIFVSDNDAIYNMKATGWFRDTIYSCFMRGSEFIIQSHGPILPATHWMPLPESPKE